MNVKEAIVVLILGSLFIVFALFPFLEHVSTQHFPANQKETIIDEPNGLWICMYTSK